MHAALVPDLRLDGLRKCGLYVDCLTNDSRLTLANVRSAGDAGSTVVNYAEVVELRLERGRVVGAEILADGTPISVRARAVVNASGPWLDTRATARESSGRDVDQAQQGGSRAARAGTAAGPLR